LNRTEEGLSILYNKNENNLNCGILKNLFYGKSVEYVKAKEIDGVVCCTQNDQIFKNFVFNFFFFFFFFKFYFFFFNFFFFDKK
jgi:hypothetical protein